MATGASAHVRTARTAGPVSAAVAGVLLFANRSRSPRFADIRRHVTINDVFLACGRFVAIRERCGPPTDAMVATMLAVTRRRARPPR